MRILITGAAGFLGGRAVDRLAIRHEVFALIRKPGALPNGAKPVICDLAGSEELKGLPAEIDSVLHLAQSPRYREFPAGARDMFEVNVAATFRLLEYALAAGARQFVLASTGSVYRPSDAAASESEAVEPASFYPASKLAAETIARPYADLLRVCIHRLFFLYGPGQAGRLVPDLINRVRSGRPVQIAGRGDGLVLTPTYVDDAVDVLQAAIEGLWMGTFNVSAPHAVSIHELGETIGTLLEVEPLFERVEGETPAPLIPDLRRLSERYDISRFRRVENGLREMLRTAVDR